MIAASLLALAAPIATGPLASIAAIEDREAIEALFYACGRSADAQDFSTLAKLFVRDGE